MNTLQKFFLFCAGSNLSILKRTPTEISKHTSIGATIFFTGLFAAIAAGFALSTIFDNSLLIIPVAILWGVMIFNLDRFIVSTMKKKGSAWRDFGSATPRIILAILISIVIAKPLELKIFESEIEAELVKMQQENYKVQDDLVKDRFNPTIDSLYSTISVLKNEIDTKAAERDSLVKAAVMEADGTGGSMLKNLGPIYKTKRAAADVVQAELDALVSTNGVLIDQGQSRISQLSNDMKTELDAMNRVQLSGFAARLEGLERAGHRSKAIYWSNIFIMLLFIAIETAPVITKLIIDKSPYDFVLDKHEAAFELNHNALTVRQRNQLRNQIAFETQSGDYKTGLAIKAEKDIATEQIKRKVEELTKDAKLHPDFLSKPSLFGV